MNKASLVAKQLHLQKWAEDIHSCNQRPQGTTVDEWCRQRGINKATYYWRLRAVREACIEVVQNDTSNPDTGTYGISPNFVELHPVGSSAVQTSAVTIKLGNASMEIPENISDAFLLRIMEAASHA